MACHHSSHHVHSHHHQPCCCCCYCCSCASSCCQPSPHPAIPNATAATANDPLLQAIAAHLLQSPPPAPQPAYQLYNQQYPKTHYSHPHPHHQQPQPQTQTQQAQSLIQSLLGRIAALESSLPHLSPPPAPPAVTKPAPPPRKPRPSHPAPPANPRVSMRDLAARTIQARFRLFLVQRSQALRHLKHLAAVKSHVAAIKSSLSDETRLDPDALSEKATDLLLQLDSIQSTDPMIREGKRSISHDLVRLLEFADGVSVKRHELFMESMEIAEKGVDPAAVAEEPIEELAGFSTAFGVYEEESDATGSPQIRASTAKTAKRVSFVGDGKTSRVSTAAGPPFTEEEVMGRVRISTKEPSYFSGVAEHGVGAQWGGGGGASGDENSPRDRQKAGAVRPVANGSPSGQRGSSHSLGLSAPLPVQMEPRRGGSKKKNVAVV